MWTIINNTPFATGQSFTQEVKTGDLVWMVGVKATFDIDAKTNELSIADEQTEVYDVDEYVDSPLNSSLLHACDFAPYKPNVDILLDASAFVPEEKFVAELEVGFIVGRIKKLLKVIGNRYYGRSLGILYKTSPVPFSQKAITYGRAYGGWQEHGPDKPPLFDRRNPCGTGFFKKRRYATDIRLPNIEYPGFPTRRNPKKNVVAGFGPISPQWEPRITFAGTYDENPDRDVPIQRPPDFNPLYYQSAPGDQQLKEVKGGESIILYHLHPDFVEIHCRLPRVKIEFETLIANQTTRQLGKLYSIIITPHELKLQMVWQANVSNGPKSSDIKGTQITCTIG